ncbi:MAG: DUF6786 family protein [Candidatus Omnitrophota bacterium]
MDKYRELQKIKKGSLLQFGAENSAFCLAPDMGGRVFAQVCGLTMHRIDLNNASNPNQPFNNFGGGNFWPAPEGGKFGFNYCGEQWYVQEAINNQPFEVKSFDRVSALIEKEVSLRNRTGKIVETRMKRELASSPLPSLLRTCNLKGSLVYTTTDSFEVLNPVSLEEGLIAGWTLEQFDATKDTVSFCPVKKPERAINFDFYEHPGDRITYHRNGFTYRTDGLKKGQVGIKQNANPQMVGFFDLKRNILCVRQNLAKPAGKLYFNIADNEQPEGPFSAADTYSIFNSGSDMNFFELETIGGADVRKGRLTGSQLISLTSFAVFKEQGELKNLITKIIG